MATAVRLHRMGNSCASAQAWLTDRLRYSAIASPQWQLPEAMSLIVLLWAVSGAAGAPCCRLKWHS